MVAFAVKNFGGMIPRTESRNLPDTMGEQAWNCDLSGGVLEGLPIPELIIDLANPTAFVPPPAPPPTENFGGRLGLPTVITPPAATVTTAPIAYSPAGTARRAYRYPGPVINGVQQADVWIALPSEFSSVCRSPLADDTEHRVYWTNPNDGAYWATYAMLAAGVAPFSLGTYYPVSELGVIASGGTLDGSIPLVARSYVYTFVNNYGEESAPSEPSAVVDGASDGSWAISGIPTLDGTPAVPQSYPGKNYPPITAINIYRTITGTTTGAQFYLVTTIKLYGSDGAPVSGYVDTTADTALVNNNTLYSAAFNNPLDGLDGLTALPGGMLVGFTDNTVHFCEPDRPHAWPAAYDQSVDYPISGFGVWQQSLVVLTHGFPSTGTGSSPASFVFSQVRVPEPCVSRGSIITDLMGVYYASQNGLVMLNYFGMQNQTLATLTKNIWLTTFNAAGIIACRHRSQYLAINGTDTGFLIDYAEQRMGIVSLSTFAGVTCIWNDEYTGDAYIIAGGKVYRWDSQNTGPQIYRWRSKQFYGDAPTSLGACQVSLDPDVLTPPGAAVAPPLGNGDPALVLPPGVNAVFNLYAGPDGRNLILTKNLTEPREIFRLPSGFKSFDWQCEIVGQVGVRSIELGSTMKELRSV